MADTSMEQLGDLSQVGPGTPDTSGASALSEHLTPPLADVTSTVKQATTPRLSGPASALSGSRRSVTGHLSSPVGKHDLLGGGPDANRTQPLSPGSPASKIASTSATPPRQRLQEPADSIQTPSQLPRYPDHTTSTTPSGTTGAYKRLSPLSPSPLRLTKAASPRSQQPISSEGVRRLVIRKLVLVNFKSYAGVQEIGPFNTSFSAVIGPNGSGKSNVIDSLLFVFGFRANKMRHGKLSNLIHKSEHHPNLQFCRVEVHFEDVKDFPDGRTEDVPDSGLVVSRTVTTNNGFSYDINGRRSSHAEVTTLLKGRGIDLDHKRFLILQGEVESIAMMRAKAENGSEDGLLEYLEDVIGTSDYKPLIEDAEKAVDDLRAGMDEKQGRFDFAQKELDALESKRKAIEQYMINQNHITLLSSSLHQIQRFRSQKQLDNSRELLSGAQEALTAEQEKNKTTHDTMGSVNAQIEDESQALTHLQAELNAVTKKVKSYKVQTVKVEEQRQQAANKASKLERTVQAAGAEINLSQSWLTEHTEDASQLESSLRKAHNDLSEESEKLSEIQGRLREKTRDITAEIDKLQLQVQPWRNQIQDKDAEMRTVRSDLDFIQSHQAEETSKFQVINSRAKEIAESGQAADKQLRKLKKQSSSLDEELNRVEDAAGEAQKRLEETQQQLDSLRSSVAGAHDSRNAAQTQNKLVTELLKLRDEGKLKGLYGRLGSLGSIDAKYDVAISTAVRGLDDLVVDTVETGQKCLDILRQRNLGRAKFILLDRLPKQNMAPVQTPENVSRLFDLVKPRDPKFAPAFFSAMGNTLVAQDLEQARRVAYGRQRFRVVSLQGMLVEMSGAMSGGGQVFRGKMASHAVEEFSLEALAKLEKELASKEMDLVEIRHKAQALHDERSRLVKAKPELDMELSKIQLSVSSLETRMRDIKEQRSSAKASLSKLIEANKPRQKTAEERLKTLGEEREQLVTDSNRLEAAIQEHQERILSVGGLELRMQNARVQDIRDQLDTLRQRQNETNETRAKMLQTMKKKQAVRDEAESELEKLKADMELLDSNLVERRTEESHLEQESSNLYGSVATKQVQVDDLKANLAELRLQAEESQAEELRLQQDVKRYGEEVARHSNIIDRATSELSSLSLFDVSQARDLRKDLDLVNGRSENSDIVMSELSDHTPDELRSMDVEEIRARLAEYEELLEDQRVNEDVLVEYREKFVDFKNRRDVLSAAVSVFKQKKADHAALKQRRLDEFTAGFESITRKLKEMYKLITLTGNADLEFVDSMDPFAEGIAFSVMPPGKSWKNISNLSGGEKTLSSLALVFALHHYKPTPLYVMDEIDAALDFRNVSIIANYIKERTRNGQFIVISLRSNMFDLADRLIGIYKYESMTRSTTVEVAPARSQTQ